MTAGETAPNNDLERIMKAMINVWGFPMNVEGDYQPNERASYDCPGCAESFSLSYCYVGGVDISEMLTDRQVEQIENEVIKNHGEVAHKEAADQARFDEWRDEQRMGVSNDN